MTSTHLFKRRYAFCQCNRTINRLKCIHVLFALCCSCVAVQPAQWAWMLLKRRFFFPSRWKNGGKKRWHCRQSLCLPHQQNKKKFVCNPKATSLRVPVRSCGCPFKNCSRSVEEIIIVWHDWFWCMIWFILMWDMTHSDAWHASFCAWHDALICVTPFHPHTTPFYVVSILIDMCVMTHCHIFMRILTNICI